MTTIKWSEELPPNGKDQFYNHVIGETPFGRITMTWKGWKGTDYHGLTIDEFPNNDGHLYGKLVYTVAEAKAACEEELHQMITSLGYNNGT